MSRVSERVGSLRSSLGESGALQFGEFTLTSGKKSSYYVDMKTAFTDPVLLRQVAESLVPYTEGFHRVAGTELGAVPLLVSLALETGLPYLIIRKGERAHGTEGAYEGEVQEGERVLLVEDVATTGGTLQRAINLLRDEGAVVDLAVCVVDREEGAEEKLREMGVGLEALLQTEDLHFRRP